MNHESVEARTPAHTATGCYAGFHRGGAMARLHTTLLCTSGLALVLGLTLVSPAEAQSSSSSTLPTIVVEGQRQDRDAPATVGDNVPGQATGERGTGPVQGYVATRSVTGTKTDTPILETPQSISVVTRQQVEAQGSQNLQEAIRYTPSASIETNGSSSQFDYVYVRGLSVPQYRDGLRLPFDPPLGFAHWRTEPYGLERIEVLRGPASGIYGQGSPAGIISMVSKRPTETRFNEVLFQTGTYGRGQMGFDFSGPADAEGKWLYRLTGLGRFSDAEIDFNHEKRAFIAPAFTFRPSQDTSFTFLGQYQKEDIAGPPHQYIPAQGSLLFNPNGHIARSLNVQDPNTDRLRRETWAVGYAFEHRFSDVWQFRQNLRYASVDIKLRSLRGEGLMPDLRTLIRSDFDIPTSAQSFTVDSHLQADFATGPFIHKLLMGTDYLDLQSAQKIFYAPADPIDIFAPVYARTILPLSPFSDYEQGRKQLGFYAQDQIKFAGFILTLTGRQDFADTQYIDKLGSNTTRQDSRAFTGRAALGYLFDNGVAPYLSYSTSFDPISGADRSGTVFVPTTGESIEVGIKYQPTWLPWTLFTFAAFDLTEKNRLTPDPDPALAALGFQVQTGEIRVRGVEFEAKTSFTKGFNLVAAASYLEPEITKSTIAEEVGKTVPLIAQAQASLWADYTLQSGPAAGFGLGGGVRHIGASWSDNINSERLRIPAYTLFDAALYYDFGYRFPDLRGLKFDIVASNLFDKEYVSVCWGGDGYCNYGAGRRVLATLRYQWQ
jgi:iron complex outermembrane receptor protein